MANPNNNDPINLDIKALNDANIKIKDIISNVGNVQSNFDKVNEEIEEFNSLTSDLNEALKIQTKEVKDIAIEFEKYYELKLKLDKANKDELKFQQSYKTNIEKINDLEKDKVKNIIEEGVDARRNLGEQLSKSKKAQNELNAAIAKGGAFTGNIDDLRNKAIVAAKNLQEEEEKSLKLSQAISGEWGVLGINLNDIEKSYAAQAIQQRLAQERAEDYKNNHKDQLVHHQHH